ncbi:outer membrane protein [Modicisalibacter ilicicola DSM 19980]|uniref:Outer membrane protein n=1 Tax=Modicisalibacter ilicicola DSM 19980 TaxID=1121942 RepID=A0A1M4SXI2_9GAMM|nr:TolC family outer membrane protein [Halomonas ilicicola]SHE36902.1 outer membrane protein [Halomonas ilicicola DSM 19980]
MSVRKMRASLTRPGLVLGLLLSPLAVAQSGEGVPGSATTSGADAFGGGEVDATLPSLPALFGQALEHDAELARQRYDMQATAQQVPQARAGLRPQIDASAGYLYQDTDNYYTGNPDFDPGNEFIDLDNETRFEGQSQDTTWQVQLTQPLFSLERWRQVDKAEAQRDAAELQVAVAERDLALMVSEAYLDAYLASRKLGLLDSKREALALQVNQAQRAFDLGIGDRINLLESESRRDQAVADQVRAENELENALSDLQRLTGRLPEFSGVALKDLESLDIESDWGEVEAWLERTPGNVEVRLARQQQRVAREDTGVRRAGHYPEVNLNLGYVDRESNDPFRDSESASANLELNVPIYRGGFTTASVRQGELNVLASEAAYTNSLNLARQEVRKRLRSLRGDARQIEALKRSIESSQLFLEAAEKGEQLGLRDLVDVLDARAELYDLRIQFVEVVRQYLLDTLSLEAAVGDLGTEDLAEVNALLARISG